MSDLDEHLRHDLAERADRVQLSTRFADRVGAADSRRRQRRRVGVTVTAALVVLAALGVTLQLTAGDDDSTTVVAGPAPLVGTPGEWTTLPEGPLSPRDSPLSFAVGDEILLFGGYRAAGCPPGADCLAPQPTLRDGASFDVTSGTWRSIADTPRDIDNAAGAVIGDRLYLLAADRCGHFEDCQSDYSTSFLAYDVGDDSWLDLASPPIADVEDLQLAADGDRIIGYDTAGTESTVDLAYSPDEDTWTELPVDRLRPTFDRVIVAHDDDLYLFAVPTIASPPADSGAAYYQAAVLTEGATEWEHLPDSEVIGVSSTWYPIGALMVAPSPGAPAGSTERAFPPGGILDTATNNWEPLPPPPSSAGPFYELGITAGDRLIASQGLVLDAAAGTWTPLPKPTGIAEYGFTAAWANDTLVVWGGTVGGETRTAGGETTAAGAYWIPLEPG